MVDMHTEDARRIVLRAANAANRNVPPPVIAASNPSSKTRNPPPLTSSGSNASTASSSGYSSLNGSTSEYNSGTSTYYAIGGRGMGGGSDLRVLPPSVSSTSSNSSISPGSAGGITSSYNHHLSGLENEFNKVRYVFCFVFKISYFNIESISILNILLK